MNSLKKIDPRGLIYLAILVLVAAVFIYMRGKEESPGDYQVKTGNYRLEDGQLTEALNEFLLALEKKPDHPHAHLGLAITYMQMKRYEEAEEEFSRTIALEPELAAAYADRGILLDRLGRYEEALADYKKALAIDAGVLEGPGWLWRFLRNMDKKPPAVADRARYLEEELQKPPDKRLLTNPEIDKQQRMYKVDG